MKRMKERILKKLRGNAGESLAEVLIALLIAALALTMLASVISSTAKMLTRGKLKMSEYYTANEVVAAQKDAAPAADEPDAPAPVQPKYTFTLNDESDATTEYYLFDSSKNSVSYYENDKAGDDNKVVSYKWVK